MESCFNSSSGTALDSANTDNSTNFLLYPNLALTTGAPSGIPPRLPGLAASHLGPPRSPPRPPGLAIPHTGPPRSPPRGLVLPYSGLSRNPGGPARYSGVLGLGGPDHGPLIVSPARHSPLASSTHSGSHGSPPRQPASFIPYAALSMSSTHHPGLAPILGNTSMTHQPAINTVSSVLPPRLQTSAKKCRSAPFGSSSIRNTESAAGRSPNQIMSDRTASEIEHEDGLKTELLVRF